MPSATDDVLAGLNTLLNIRGPGQPHFPATPFVRSEQEFGIQSRLQIAHLRGSLRAVDHVLQGLERGGFFAGRRHPGTGLDDLHTLKLGETRQVYEGVTVDLTSADLTLSITTQRPVAEILTALAAGARAAQAKLDQREEEESQFAQRLRQEFAKETVDPVFDADRDIEWVRGYLQGKTAEYCDGECAVGDQRAADDLSVNHYEHYGIVDRRPYFNVFVETPPDSFERSYESLEQAFATVFTCPGAVLLYRHPRVSCEVRGNPARLVRDIIENDPEWAQRLERRLGWAVPAELRLGPKDPTGESSGETLGL